MESHLLQMRGLKHPYQKQNTQATKSHLLQMRGLKPGDHQYQIQRHRRIFYRCVD